MIRYTHSPTAGIGVEQVESKKTVYLDHWALRLFSTDKILRKELIDLVLDRECTLMLSTLNIMEFSQTTDLNSHLQAEDLVQQLLPHIFFLESNPFTVIDRENHLLAGGVPAPPHADSGLLREFAHLKTTSLGGFTAQGLFSPMCGSASTKEEFCALADKIVNRIELLRLEHTSSPNFQHVIRRSASGEPLQHGTRYVLRELVRTFLLNKNLVLTRNHAIDLLHSVVPVSYCDYVLLDAHWEDQVGRVRDRFVKRCIHVPIASVFSKKAQGVSRFLSSLATT